MAYKQQKFEALDYLFSDEEMDELVVEQEDTVDFSSADDGDKLNNSNIIRNISFDQSEILHNIMELHNGGKAFVCDMTASELKFYKKKKGDKYAIPEPEILFDVFPKQEKIKKIEPYGKLPLDDDSIESIVIDLPFVVSPPNAPSAVSNKEGASLIFKRFWGYYPVDDLYSNYFHWISEAYRVLKPEGLLVFKTQSTISGGISHNIEEWAFMCGQYKGFHMIDKFYLQAKARLISAAKIKKQQHARKYTSSFLVFRKALKKKSKDFNYFQLIEKCAKEENDRMANAVSTKE